MRLHSYVVARDFGFAPNPFYGWCTLATCKPEIRRTADLGDWVVGTGSATNRVQGHLIFLMRVEEDSDFDKYWDDPRFQCKKPNLRGSKKQAFGDNIYHRLPDGSWHQERSHHTHADGTCNAGNISNDTGTTTRLLLSRTYAYWGELAPIIPAQFRDFDGHDICAGRGHKNRFPQEMVEQFVNWVVDRNEWGFLGRPLDWKRSA